MKVTVSLTIAQCNVLEKIAHRSGMDCWFFIDSNCQIRDLEQGNRRLSVHSAISMLRSGMTDYKDYGLSENEISIFKHLCRQLKIPD